MKIQLRPLGDAPAAGNVKKVMKSQSGRRRKTSTSLPLEGGGKRVGVKELRDVASALRKGSTDTEVFMSIEGVLETIRVLFSPLTLTLSPKGRGE